MMTKSTKQNTTLLNIQQQKTEVKEQMKQERQLMSIYTTALLDPLQKKQEGPTTPMKYLMQKMHTAGYAFKLSKGIFSLFKIFK